MSIENKKNHKEYEDLEDSHPRKLDKWRRGRKNFP